MPPPQLLTRTFASPAWVNQIPLTSAPACASLADEVSDTAKNALTKPNLQAIQSPKKQACIAANSACAM
jgi:hypothetical protein